MSKIGKILFALLFVMTVHAEDKLVQDTLIRSLKPFQGSLVLFKNPIGESTRTIVFCLWDEEMAINSLIRSDSGGVMLLPGSQIVFKNDQNKTFLDGSNLKGKFIQIECNL